MRNIVSVFLAFYLIMSLLAGCEDSINGTLLDLTDIKTNPSRIIHGAQEDIDASLGDIGLFYSENCLLKYFDFTTEQAYILCSNANCTHKSEECSAYFERNVYGESACSVAQIDGYVYCTYVNAVLDSIDDPTAEKAIQLLQIDLSNGIRTVIASFPCVFNATEEDENFYATSISNVYYCNGHAWFSLSMQQRGTIDTPGLEYKQLTGVNLATGQVIALNGYDDYSYTIDNICVDTVYFSSKRDLVPMLTIEDYYELYASDGTVTIDGNVFTDYYMDYWVWHTNEYSDEYTIFAYHISTGSIETVYSNTTIKVENGQLPQLTVYGEWEGKLLCREFLSDEKGNYSSIYHAGLYLLDLTDGTKEEIVSFENGGALTVAQGTTGNLIFTDGTFFYAELTTKNTADIYVYDFNTRESTFLFTDDAAITFRIYGEHNDGFIGKHKDYQDDMSFYWISKEDFYAGNLDAAIKYQL